METGEGGGVHFDQNIILQDITVYLEIMWPTAEENERIEQISPIMKVVDDLITKASQSHQATIPMMYQNFIAGNNKSIINFILINEW